MIELAKTREEARAIAARLKPLHNALAAQDWPLRAELWIAEALAVRDQRIAELEAEIVGLQNSEKVRGKR